MHKEGKQCIKQWPANVGPENPQHLDEPFHLPDLSSESQVPYL